MKELQVTTVLDGVRFVGTLEPVAASVEHTPAEPVQYDSNPARTPRIRPCLKRHGGAKNQTPLFWVNVRWADKSNIKRFAVGADVIEDGKRRLWLRPEYASSGRKMKAYSKNSGHPNHGFSLYIELDGTAVIAKTGARIIGEARRPR